MLIHNYQGQNKDKPFFSGVTYFFPATSLNPNQGPGKSFGLHHVLEPLRMCAVARQSQTYLSLFVKAHSPRAPPSLQSPDPRTLPQSLPLETVLDSCGILTGIPPVTPAHTHTRSFSFLFMSSFSLKKMRTPYLLIINLFNYSRKVWQAGLIFSQINKRDVCTCVCVYV